jgi:hypothetical protein
VIWLRNCHTFQLAATALWRERDVPAAVEVPPPWLLGQYGRSGRALAQQSHEPNKQRAGIIDQSHISGSKSPAVRRYEFEMHERPLFGIPLIEKRFGALRCASPSSVKIREHDHLAHPWTGQP